MLKNVLKVFLIALFVFSLAVPVVCAEPVKGEVVLFEGGTYTVKDRDGKEYKITEDLAVGLDLETGDLVEIELEDAKPVKVKEVKE